MKFIIVLYLIFLLVLLNSASDRARSVSQSTLSASHHHHRDNSTYNFNSEENQHADDPRAYEDKVLEVITNHPGESTKTTKSPKVKDIKIEDLKVNHPTPMRLDRVTQELLESDPTLTSYETKFQQSMKSHLKSTANSFEKMYVELMQNKEKLGSDFQFNNEIDEIQKYRALLRMLTRKSVIKAMKIGKTPLSKLEPIIRETVQGLSPAVEKGRSIVRQMAGVTRSTKRFSSTNLHTKFANMWFWDKIVSFIKSVVNKVISVVSFVYKVAMSIAKSLVMGIKNAVKAIINGNLIPNQLNQDCYGFCVNGLTCNVLKMKCVPSAGGKIPSLLGGCVFSAISNLKSEFSKAKALVQQNGLTKDVIVSTLCNGIGATIIKSVMCVSPGLQFMANFFKTVSVGVEMSLTIDNRQVSGGLKVGLDQDGTNFCSFDVCTGISTDTANIDASVNVEFSTSFPKVGDESDSYSVGFELFDVGVSVGVGFSDDDFESFSMSAGVGAGGFPISLSALTCKTVAVAQSAAKPIKKDTTPISTDLTDNANSNSKDYILNKETLYGGDALISILDTEGKASFVTRMQDDCNLVTYGQDGSFIWASNTWTSDTSARPCKVKITDNGDAQVLNAKNTVLSTITSNPWQGSGNYKLLLQKSGNLGLYKNDIRVWSHGGNNVLSTNEFLVAGQYIENNNDGNGNEVFRLIMQKDCNLVGYYCTRGQESCNYNNHFWASNSNGKGSNCYLIMQSDCNLVIYNGDSNAVWSSGTYGRTSNTPCYMNIDTRRNIRIRDSKDAELGGVTSLG